MGLDDLCTLTMCKPTLTPISLRNHAQIRGGIVAKRLMSTLAYGWVDRYSDVARCETNSV